jgi:hypothetical protein
MALETIRMELDIASLTCRSKTVVALVREKAARLPKMRVEATTMARVNGPVACENPSLA